MYVLRYYTCLLDSAVREQHCHAPHIRGKIYIRDYTYMAIYIQLIRIRHTVMHAYVIPVLIYTTQPHRVIHKRRVHLTCSRLHFLLYLVKV